MSFTRFLHAVDSYLRGKGYYLNFGQASVAQAAALRHAHASNQSAGTAAEKLLAKWADTPCCPRYPGGGRAA